MHTHANTDAHRTRLFAHACTRASPHTPTRSLPSPPPVPSFVEEVARRRSNGLPAQVRTVAYCGDDGTVAYSMIGPGSHMCLRVDRCHRSNHVFFVVDFGTGKFCQKCHDPECWGFRSPWNPLPADVWGREALTPMVETRQQQMVEQQAAAAEAAGARDAAMGAGAAAAGPAVGMGAAAGGGS